MVKKKKATKKAKEGSIEPYTITLKSFGRTYTAEGETLQDALLALKPGKVVGISVLKVDHGDQSSEKIIPGNKVSRLYATGGLVQQILLKQVSSHFNI